MAASAVRSSTALSDRVRTIELEARATAWELAPGRTVRALTYNGQVPGPEIRVREGERLRVVLRNRLEEPTTIHWHGVDVPNSMDGAPGLTQPAVQPGETFVYEFTARPAGTRWYHTHVEEHRQMDLGLVAPLIIEPRDPEAIAVDGEVTLVLDDWATGTGPALPSTREGVAGAAGGMGGMMRGRSMRGGMRGGMGGMMGRGMPGMMGGGHTPAHDVMTINGKAYPATEPLRARKGQRLRLRLINASAEHTHVVRVGGHRLAVTHTDGNPLRAPIDVDAIPLAPSERCDAVLDAVRPGAWWLYCTQPGHAEAGEKMAVLYDGHEQTRLGLPDLDVSALTLWHESLGRGRPILPPAHGSPRAFDLVLGGGMMGSDVWTINRRVYPDTEPLVLRKDQPARITLRNMSPEAHPMHLHGQSFRVVGANGRAYPEPVVKDSVDVGAHMGSVVLEFTAHNPGDWLFHCHKPMHMMGGMVSLVKVG